MLDGACPIEQDDLFFWASVGAGLFALFGSPTGLSFANRIFPTSGNATQLDDPPVTPVPSICHLRATQPIDAGNGPQVRVRSGGQGDRALCECKPLFLRK